jgi:hypothetical protein
MTSFAVCVLFRLQTDGSTAPEVHVLTGGFNAWANHWTKIATDEAGKSTFALDDLKRVAGMYY